jgi:hypothetical protein
VNRRIEGVGTERYRIDSTVACQPGEAPVDTESRVE